MKYRGGCAMHSRPGLFFGADSPEPVRIRGDCTAGRGKTLPYDVTVTRYVIVVGADAPAARKPVVLHPASGESASEPSA